MSKYLVALLIGFIPAVLALDPALLSPALHHHQIFAAALAIPAAEPLAFTIRGFCKVHGLSVASYYALKKLGLGPREMHLAGNLIRISAEAQRRGARSARIQRPMKPNSWRYLPSNGRSEAARRQKKRLKAQNTLRTGGGCEPSWLINLQAADLQVPLCMVARMCWTKTFSTNVV